MGAAGNTVTGKCLCGAVTFAADVSTRDVDACHCSMCRRWSAGPYIGLSHNGPVTFTGAENIGAYKSSEWAERGFCKVCGSSLFYHLLGTEHYSFSANALDDQSGFSLTSQIFIDEKPAYYDFANDTPKLTGAEVFAAFAKAGEAEQNG
ncbi:GFA family protein [Hyphomicrobium sp.]|uniref:GFA family protein n=1 Tax=Hyphomicrobium sp. TaxID=82 RepID=UPI002E31EC0C|nr:GFA family protein [Hyphomicrobium sp.]HEX2842757.1 GFA family protein [Hyphomicrobium sp.]